MNALEITDLSKKYHGFQLDHLSLTLPSGCVMGLIGENGAGKSTTIKLILDMVRKDSGSIQVLGRDHHQHACSLREEMGVVLDEIGLPECLTAKQIAQIMRHTFRQWEDATYEKLLHRLQIPEGKPFREYSRGMKMKMGIAIALSHRPKLLLLDEATSGLDPVVRDDVLDLFYDFTRDESHSILISSHIVSDLEKLCDYIAFLHQGQLLLCEEKDVLREEYRMVRCTPEQLAHIPASAVKGSRTSPYGVEAIVERTVVPHGMSTSPAHIEELFVFMAKETKNA